MGVSPSNDTTGSVSTVCGIMDTMQTTRDELETRWRARDMLLELNLRFRLFEEDTLKTLCHVSSWAQETQRSETVRSGEKKSSLI